jgi:CheY-like chemotaxis protein
MDRIKSRILVVDDEPTIVSTICMILDAHGFDAVGVNSGYAAIARVGDFCPDLLLSDIKMPGMNGFETGVEIKKLCPDCRLLFFSGYAEVLSMAEALRDSGHCFELLPKPLHPTVLVEKIKAALVEES